MQETVVITGASAGIGEACARRFAAAGHRVVLWARRQDRLEKLAGEIGELASWKVVDVADEAQVQAAAQGVSASVLINNAGCAFGRDKAQDGKLADWHAMVDINIKGVLNSTHAFLPGMVERNRGHVINLGSVAATYPYVGGNVYAGTKAFLEAFSLGLRADLLGKRIRVTNIEPGTVKTDFSIVRFRGDVEQADAIYKDLESLSGDDIAETIFWCATLPEHVNINRLEVMPTMQSFAGFAFQRNALK